MKIFIKEELDQICLRNIPVGSVFKLFGGEAAELYMKINLDSNYLVAQPNSTHSLRLENGRITTFLSEQMVVIMDATLTATIRNNR